MCFQLENFILQKEPVILSYEPLISFFFLRLISKFTFEIKLLFFVAKVIDVFVQVCAQVVNEIHIILFFCHRKLSKQSESFSSFAAVYNSTDEVISINCFPLLFNVPETHCYFPQNQNSAPFKFERDM